MLDGKYFVVPLDYSRVKEVWLSRLDICTAGLDEPEALRVSVKLPNQLALISARLADKGLRLQSLNQMMDIEDPRVHFYIVYPKLPLIRRDPRLDAVKRRIGL